ncbi:CYTH domain-containing protein [Bacillus sp. NEB1478]|uniref:CYTH domain-containing protein n=1 Tax=Bacillus sp. NEB1478 TaxID=3073816 RepID=UPI0028733F2B|nr:CYTH domain-containing protein [Bacillus sp. NEB1478]WNB90593.1 CYTH domain-containing protein [Bacillus sp. NEB1478]
MAQEIEIEFKNILTYDEFLRLLDKFSVKKSAFTEQTNFYFDTPDFHLKAHKSALRIRLKNNSYTLTLKQQYEEHILETHQKLSEEIFTSLIKGGKLPAGEVNAVLENLHIPLNEIRHLGELTTHRAEVSYEMGLLVLDKNHYLGKIDYELEYESTDYKRGKEVFLELLQANNIPARATESKIHRFFLEKLNRGGLS